MAVTGVTVWWMGHCSWARVLVPAPVPGWGAQKGVLGDEPAR
jgi:hypothetical protein